MPLFVDVYGKNRELIPVPLQKFNQMNLPSEAYPSGIAYEVKIVKKEAPQVVEPKQDELVSTPTAENTIESDIEAEFEELKAIGFTSLKGEERKRYQELKELCKKD